VMRSKNDVTAQVAQQASRILVMWYKARRRMGSGSSGDTRVGNFLPNSADKTAEPRVSTIKLSCARSVERGTDTLYVALGRLSGARPLPLFRFLGV
jgi:hypothetical protein